MAAIYPSYLGDELMVLLIRVLSRGIPECI